MKLIEQYQMSGQLLEDKLSDGECSVKKVVEVAHSVGVAVEGELGKIGGV